MTLLLNRYTRKTLWFGDDYNESVENIGCEFVGVKGAVAALRDCDYVSGDVGVSDEWTDSFGVIHHDTLHISRESGKRLTGTQINRLFKAAGL